MRLPRRAAAPTNAGDVRPGDGLDAGHWRLSSSPDAWQIMSTCARLLSLALLSALLSTALPARSSVPAAGRFTVISACPAYASFRKQTNPGSIVLAPGQQYAIEELNRPQGPGWVRLRVPQAEPDERWVALSCGSLGDTLAAQPDTAQASSRGGDCNTPDSFDSYVLALSWRGGFCRYERPDKPECAALRSGALHESHLTLHGLWPNKAACGTHYGHCSDAPLQLSPATVDALKPWMPSLEFDTGMAAHEWATHGTCQALDADAYFRNEVRAVELFDRSALGQYIDSHAGGSMSSSSFFDIARSQYGEQTANAISLVCKGGDSLEEVRVELPGVPRLDAGLRELTAGGPAARSTTIGCRGDSIRVEQP